MKLDSRTIARFLPALLALPLVQGCDPAAPDDEASVAQLPAEPLTTYGKDAFGVARLYPTRAGGREWLLPSTATRPDAEWQPGTTVTQVGANVFHVSGAPRMMVVSPSGKAWWRNVEMTSYLREVAAVNYYADQVPHWTMFARGEKHASDWVSLGGINAGVRAPFGTATWPGYPFSGTINHACLATCYHGLFYPNGKFLLEKEVSHTQGYTGPRGQITLSGFPNALGRWVGLKYVLRNMSGNTAVKAELYVDKNADGNWAKVTEATDTGNWSVTNSAMNGCGAAPFRYSTAQKVTWAGPWAAFRMDNMSVDFKWLSVREVDPLP